MTTATPAGARGPTRLTLPGRTLLLVAGMPGAGKSTLLASLPPAPGVTVVDSETYRVILRRVFGALPYPAYRPLVHAWQRLAVLVAAVWGTPTLVVHLPATDARARAAIARLAAATGRSAHLLWLDVDVAEARWGQHERGRIVPEYSFAGHSERAVATSRALHERGPENGWCSATVLERSWIDAGLRLDTPPLQAGVGTAIRGARD